MNTSRSLSPDIQVSRATEPTTIPFAKPLSSISRTRAEAISQIRRLSSSPGLIFSRHPDSIEDRFKISPPSNHHIQGLKALKYCFLNTAS